MFSSYISIIPAHTVAEKLVPIQQSLVETQYTIVEYLGGHYPTTGRGASQLKNPLWRVLDVDNTPKLIMYCEPNALCILCDESMRIIREFERAECDGKTLTFYLCGNGYIMSHIPQRNKLLCMHQIIMNCYGNGRGTKMESVDHIDRNPLNNSLCNLRIATRHEQEQNSKGIAPNTKRARQNIARPLPDGIEQDMLRKYVVYYVEQYNKEKGLSREYFRVEHPALDIAWQTTSSKEVSILDKLHSANKVAEDLENGIMPTKPDRELPKYFTMDKTATYLVFDRRRNGQRCTMRLPITEQSAVAEQLEKMKQLLIEKYDENVFI